MKACELIYIKEQKIQIRSSTLTFIRLKLFNLMLLATAGAAISVSASAQQTTPAANPPSAQTESEIKPGEIVVTAQKRRQSVQDVGASVTALGNNALASIGRQDVTALAGQIPSLQVNQYSPTLTIFNIRGVSQNDFADSQEAPVAFYADEVYVSSLGAISGQNFDLERVEVLRGPQGTLFGRNATGGLIQIISAKPTRKLSGFLTLTVGSYGQFASEGALSGPLTDWLRARVSFTTDNHGGYISNRIGPDIGNSNFYGVRVQLAADVGADGQLTVKYQRLRNTNERSGGLYSFAAAAPDPTNDGLGRFVGRNEDFYGTGAGADPFGYAEPDNNPFTGSYDRIGFFDRTVDSVTARYEHNFGSFSLTSLSDYQSLRKAYGEDTDSSPNPIFNFDTGQKLDQLSQELRLNGKSDVLTWVAGAYFLDIKSRNSYLINSPADILPQQNYGGRLHTSNWALFGQAEYKLNDQLTFILGGRYSSDIKSLDFTHATAGVTDFTFNPAGNPGLARQIFRDWSGKVQINYKPTRDILLYAGVNRGTKSGGFGTQAFTPIDPSTLPFGSEKLINYEAGYKISLLDRKLTINGAGFIYDYENYQAFQLVGLSQFITNLPARIHGTELEIVARPVNGLTLQFLGTYLDGLSTVLRCPVAGLLIANCLRRRIGHLGRLCVMNIHWGRGAWPFRPTGNMTPRSSSRPSMRARTTKAHAP